MTTTNLGQISAIFIGTTPPSNTKMMWYDDNVGQKILKYYDIGTTTWKSFDGVGVYLPLTGGVMSGFITLNADPTANLHAATKQYVDAAVSGAAGNLSGILAGGNTTGGNDIVMTTGDVLVFSEGLGGVLTSATTTSARTWTLPDADGTLLLGTGTANKVTRWGVGNALTDGVLLDDGTTSGVGGLDGAVLFNVESSALNNAIVGKSTNLAVAVGVTGRGEGAGSNTGLYGYGNGGTDNTGIEATGNGGASALGGNFNASGATGANIAVDAKSGLAGLGAKNIGVVGRTLGGGGSALTIGGAFGIDTSSDFLITDLPSINSAIVGIHKGLSGVGLGYGGYVANTVTNSANTNVGLYLEALNGLANHALITGAGNVGFGVSSPTKWVELQTAGSNGVMTFDTVGVAGAAYNLDVSLSDAGVKFSTSIAGRDFQFESNSVRLSTIISTGGGVAIGTHNSVDSHLHVKYGSLGDADGSIRGTMSDNTPYAYATPAYSNSLVLENEDLTAQNSSVVVFRGKDTGGTSKDLAYIGALYHSRSGSNASADLIFGAAQNNIVSEAMRVHASGNVSVGTDADLTKFAVYEDVNGSLAAIVRNPNSGTAARSILSVQAIESGSSVFSGDLVATPAGSVGSGSWLGDQKYFERAVHLITGGSLKGHINIGPRAAGNDLRFFSGSNNFYEANLRMTLKDTGAFGFNLAKAGYTGSAVDTPLSDFHVGTGALFQSTGALASEHFVVQSSGSIGGQGGLVITNSSDFVNGASQVGGFKVVSQNSGPGFGLVDDTLTLGLVDASAPNTFVDTYLFFQAGNLGVGGSVANEAITVNGVMSLAEQAVSPSNTSGFGKVFTKSVDSNLYYLDGSGVEYQLNGSNLSGSGTANEVAYFTGASSIASNPGFTFDGTTLIVPNLTVNGTTTTIDSTTVTIKDPVFTLGDDSVDDNKDRGIEFKWNQSGVKGGFFGHDDSTGRFTYIPDATNTNEVFSGTVGDVQFGTAYLGGINIPTGSSDTYFLTTDGTGAGAWNSINSLSVDGTPNGSTDYLMTWDSSAGVHKKVLVSVISAGANHNLLDGTTHPDTVSATAQRGDIIIGNPTSKWDRLGKGTANQYLKSDGTDVLYATIDISEVANALTGGGTLNELAYWSSATGLTSSSNFIFDGSNAAMYGSTIGGSAFHINDPGSSITTSLSVNNFSNGVSATNYGILSAVGSGGAYDAVAVYGVVSIGSSTTESIGIYGRTTANSAGDNIAGKFQASNAGAGEGYAIQLIDGFEGTSGRFLKNIDTVGHAQWADITEADITDLKTYAIAGTYNDGRVTRWNSTANTLESGVIRDNGTELGIGGPAAAGTAMTFANVGDNGISLNINNATSGQSYGAQFTSGAFGTSTAAYGVLGGSNAGGSGTVAVGVRGSALSVGLIFGGATAIGVQSFSGPNTNNPGDSFAYHGYARLAHNNNNYGIVIDVANSGTGTSYIGRFDDSRTAGLGKFIKSIDANGTAEWAAISASDISGGTLGETFGGTGQNTYATGDILYASATNTLGKLAAGTNGQVLTLAGGVPTWASGGGGFTLTDGNGTTANGTSVDLGGDLTSDVIITGNQNNLILGAGPLGSQVGLVNIAADSFFMYAVDAIGAPGGGNIQMNSTGLTLGASPVNGTITLLSKNINYNVFGDMGITLGSPTGTFTFAADYSANYTPRSIPDVAFVTNMLTDGNGTTALGTSVNLGGTLTGPVTINGNGSSFNMGTLSSPIQFYNSTAEEHSLFAYDTLLGSVQNQVTLDKDGFEINTTGGNGRVFINSNDVDYNIFGDMEVTLVGPTSTFAFAADYSANYTNRSIPDVAFVNNQIAASSFTLTDGNGTTANGAGVDLGGTIDSDVTFLPDLEANARNFSFGGPVSERFANTNFFNTASFNTDVDDGLGNSSKIIQNSTSLSLRSGLVFQPGNFVELQGYNIQTVSQNFIVTLGVGGEFKASADYSANYTNRSFPDVEYLNNQIAASEQTLSKTFTLESPTSSDNITMFRTDVAITVVNIRDVHTGTTPSTTFSLHFATDRDTAGTTLMASTTSTDKNNGNVQLIANASIPAGSWVWYKTTASSGTGVDHSVFIRYTED